MEFRLYFKQIINICKQNSHTLIKVLTFVYMCTMCNVHILYTCMDVHVQTVVKSIFSVYTVYKCLQSRESYESIRPGLLT